MSARAAAIAYCSASGGTGISVFFAPVIVYVPAVVPAEPSRICLVMSSSAVELSEETRPTRGRRSEPDDVAVP